MIKKNTLPEIVTIKGKKQAKIPKKKGKAVVIGKTIREIFTPCCVGHATLMAPPGFPVQGLIVQDFLVDSSGLSKGGESVNPIVQVGLNYAKKTEFYILPEACKKRFKVIMPSGINKGYLRFTFGRTAVQPVGGGGFYDAYPALVSFTGLIGSAPTITYAWFFIDNGRNNAYTVEIQGEFSSNFSFTGIKIVGNYPARNFLPAFGFYKLLSYSEPFTINPTSDVCYALFGYTSPTNVDLGQIIEIL